MQVNLTKGKESRKSLSELCEIKLITRHGPIMGPPPWGGVCVFINSLKFSDLFLTLFPSLRLVAQQIKNIYIFLTMFNIAANSRLLGPESCHNVLSSLVLRSFQMSQ